MTRATAVALLTVGLLAGPNAAMASTNASSPSPTPSPTAPAPYAPHDHVDGDADSDPTWVWVVGGAFILLIGGGLTMHLVSVRRFRRPNNAT